MAEIVALGRFATTGDADPAIVEHLKELLEEARRGEICGIAFCWVTGNGRVHTLLHQGSVEAVRIVGATSRLNWMANEAWESASE